MPAGASIIDRARKFQSLATSPNEHEAASARARLAELKAKHGITDADLVEEGEQVAQLGAAAEGNQRVELARQVAKNRNCRIAVTQRGIAFRGYPEAAKDACQLFVALVHIVERNCELPPMGPYYTDGDFLAWRACFWLGFVADIQRQLDPEHGVTPQEAMAHIVGRAPAPPLIQRIADALLRDHAPEEADQLRREAYMAGQTVGAAVPVPPYRGKR